MDEYMELTEDWLSQMEDRDLTFLPFHLQEAVKRAYSILSDVSDEICLEG